MSRDVERVPEAVALHGGVLDAQHEPGEVGQLILEQPEPGHKDLRLLTAGNPKSVTIGHRIGHNIPVPE